MLITRRIILYVFLILNMTSCSIPFMEDQDYGGFMSGGYSNRRINGNTYAVSFSANRYTDPRIIRSYLLYRAAELTMQNGFQYFVVSSSNFNCEDISFVMKTINGSSATPPRLYNTYPTQYQLKSYEYSSVPSWFTNKKSNVSAVIVMFQHQPPSGLGYTYNANQVIARLGALTLS